MPRTQLTDLRLEHKGRVIFGFNEVSVPKVLKHCTGGVDKSAPKGSPDKRAGGRRT
jgi:hypothetical protein